MGTGTQALLLVASETGHVYTFATPKLQPFVTLPEGKNLIQSCLNAPEGAESDPEAAPEQQPNNMGYGGETELQPTKITLLQICMNQILTGHHRLSQPTKLTLESIELNLLSVLKKRCCLNNKNL